jgi:hypothetical protein
MKKFIAVSMIMAFTLLTGSSLAQAQPQNPADEEKPTFYRLTPGVYVNGWPRFTVSYPKDWVERRPRFGEFRASAPVFPPLPSLYIIIWQNPIPLDKWAESWVKIFRIQGATDVTVVSDKPTRLRDGTPAQEVELHGVINGEPVNTMSLATKKGDMLILTGSSLSGKIGEDQKTMLYSIEFQPGKDEPVKVPPDVQEFLDRHCNDLLSHDLTKLMTHYSDKFLSSGNRRGEVERFFRQIIGLVTSVEVGITEFVPAGDRAYLAGFVNTYIGKLMLGDASIIKENGEWKFYGNQRDVSP